MSLANRMMILIAVVTLALSQLSLAQYGGGGTGPMGATPAPGTPGYVAPSHGYKANPALIGGLVGGGAAAGGGLFYYMRHHNVYEGCVGPDGTTLIREKDGKRFLLEGTSPLPAGEKVSLKAKKSDTDSGGATLEVEKLGKDLGRCERETAASK